MRRRAVADTNGAHSSIPVDQCEYTNGVLHAGPPTAPQTPSPKGTSSAMQGLIIVSSFVLLVGLPIIVTSSMHSTSRTYLAHKPSRQLQD